MEGKIFLCGKNTPPLISQLKQDDFVFDLQRFADPVELTFKDGSLYAGDTKLDTTTDTNCTHYTLNGESYVINSNIELDHPIWVSANTTITINSGATLSKPDTGTTENPTSYLNYNDHVIAVKRGATLTLDGEGTISYTGNQSSACGVKVTVAGEAKDANSYTAEKATLIVNGNLTIEGTGYGISGNGTRHNTSVTINGGTIKATNNASDCVGIYNPQDGDLTITGGTITGKTGVEIRAGSLTVSGENTKITSTVNTPLKSHANGNGSTSAGAGIAVVQHTTKKAITVNVNGGEISGYTALVVNNPQGNGAFDSSIGTVTVNVTGGTLTSTSTATESKATSDEIVKDGNGNDVTQYTYTGKNAIFNSDGRVDVSVSNAKINGNLAVISDGRTSANGGYNISNTNPPTFVDTFTTPGDYSKLLSYTDSGVGYGLVVPEGWIRFNGWKGIAPGGTSGVGVAAVSIEGSAALSDLKYDLDNKLFGVPESVTASWTTGFEGGGGSYYLAKYSYNNTKTEVAISSETANAIIRAGSSGILADTVKKINAGNASVGLNIIGDENITAITSGSGNDTLTAGSLGTTLDGGTGNNTLIGGAGSDLFVFGGGSDFIQGYVEIDDFISLDGIIDPVTEGDKISTVGNGFKIDFDSNGTLTFDSDVNAKVRSGGQIYTYSKDAIALNKSVTLAAGASIYALDGDNTYNAVDASAAKGAVSLVGNSYANTLTAGANGSTLDGGDGNDNLTGGTGADTFVYGTKSGKDAIYGYDVAADKLDVDTTKIISGTTNNNDELIFKIDNSNAITFKPTGDKEDQAVTKVLLAGGSDLLTKDGVLADSILTVFSEQKGKVDLGETSIYGGIAKGIDASKVTKNSITMAGGAQGGTFTFAANKKADVFEYGGGSVTLNSYEAGTDKINLVDASLTSFSVDESGNVIINTSDNAISLVGGKDQEVLLRDVNSKNNSYTTMFFHDTGVLYDKKNATSATLSTGAGNYTADASIKKIIIDEGVTAISVQAGDRNNTIIDASNAGTKDATGISLSGGSKNDKFTGGVGKDLFIYTAGKDVITNYASGDSISAEGFDLGDAKITQSKKSVTLKFSNKNSLAIKSENAIGTININGTDYNFGKNAVITGTAGSQTASLTSNFSGTYKAGSGVTTIDGSAIAKKNYTMQGTSTAETLTAGGSASSNGANKKVTFKGGGGGDSFIGGASKDSFFYARNDTGAATVDYFSYANDNVKIKRTLTKVEKTTSGLQFQMGSADNSLTLKTDDKNNNIGNSNFLIKANNTLYWFETGSEGYGLYTAKDKESKDQIKSVLRNKDSYAIVDLNYSTNLVKGKVANVTETQFTAAMAENYKIK